MEDLLREADLGLEAEGTLERTLKLRMTRAQTGSRIVLSRGCTTCQNINASNLVPKYMNLVHRCNRSKDKIDWQDLIEQEEAKVEQVVLVVLPHLNINTLLCLVCLF